VFYATRAKDIDLDVDLLLVHIPEIIGLLMLLMRLPLIVLVSSYSQFVHLFRFRLAVLSPLDLLRLAHSK
jgi:hypothetical protein